MGLVNAGTLHISQQVMGSAPTFSNSNTYLGVGNGTAAETTTQTDLTGASRLRKKMDVGYPAISGDGTITFRATFDVNEAAFDWQEWGLFNAASGGTMICRIREANGTKLANQTWVLLVTIKFIP